ncbi:SDR family oxidoreductase [Bradyrhizobium sp. 21]|uniref:SDR family NAD(P)-dependent oxidoreductase n=1 Tax=Bradyrhizobium sp. 21 TaxID=2782666 RepID=UPI001FFA6FE8|nr:SDR family oxidoreductase [Bradyrhizobium sp. 21]MCK1387645.1 SDR family oxidoreductase [Bradyrhizobium sp. 21]
MQTSGKMVLVTGGSRGLGLGIVRDLLECGYVVGTCSRRRSRELEDLERRFTPARFAWFACEIGDAESEASTVAQFTNWTTDARPYALINNAGIAVEGVLATFPAIEIERVVGVNLVGALRLARLMLRTLLRERSGGRLINISSIIGSRGYSGLAAYSATKAGLDGATRSLAREVGRRLITVNSIAPGYLTTEMSRPLSPTQRTQIERRTPLGRLGKVEDVTPVVRFLLSDNAQFITGQTIVVDGGITS